MILMTQVPHLIGSEQDWQKVVVCLNSPVWDQVWGDNVRFAVLTENYVKRV